MVIAFIVTSLHVRRTSYKKYSDETYQKCSECNAPGTGLEVATLLRISFFSQKQREVSISNREGGPIKIETVLVFHGCGVTLTHF